MSITTKYDLKNAIWTPATGPSIAANLPEGMRCIVEPDGWRFYIEGTKDYAGSLWHTSVPMLPVLQPFTATLSVNLNPDDAVATNAQALELDLMYADQSGNIGNGSGELQEQAGGIWQAITSGNTWTNVPGWTPESLPAEQWTPISVSHDFDPAKEMSQLRSITIGPETVSGTPFPPQPFAKLAWQPNILVIQIQGDVIKGGGAFSWKIKNDACVTVTYA